VSITTRHVDLKSEHHFVSILAAICVLVCVWRHTALSLVTEMRQSLLKRTAVLVWDFDSSFDEWVSGQKDWFRSFWIYCYTWSHSCYYISDLLGNKIFPYFQIHFVPESPQ